MKVIVPPSRYYEFEQQVEITPLTILVGESDTGKTTFASCVPLYLGSHVTSDYKVWRSYERVLAREAGMSTNSVADLGIVSEAMIPPGTRRYTYIQHPACRLHPRAQAAVGSFLTRMVREGRQILVETHSDYLIDRVMIEVAKDSAPLAEKVSLLYFAKKKPICSIKVDRQGNLIDPPKGYRQWFLEEQARRLGVT